jgi:uncharacterized protein YbjT (DUF2867 family)
MVDRPRPEQPDDAAHDAALRMLVDALTGPGTAQELAREHAYLDAFRALSASATAATAAARRRRRLRLAAAGGVAALARHAQRLHDRPWFADVEVVEGDAADPATLRRALDAVDVAYYLLHSLGSGPRLESTDRHTAREFARAAREGGVQRLVYLGGLYPEGEDLSRHLDSRREVGEILLASGVPTAVLRGSDHRVGVGVVRDAALPHRAVARHGHAPVGEHPDPADRHPGRAALPGRERHAPPGRQPRLRHRRPGRALTYRDMMQRYAAVAGLTRRVILPVNVLTPRLSSHRGWESSPRSRTP